MILARLVLTVCLAMMCALVASPARAGGPTAHDTVIHPGDQLAVQVFGDATLTQNVMVLSDGTVEYPLIGRVAVAGLTPDQAADALAAKLLRYVRHPVVTISIAQLAQPDVLVLGDVKNPGKYQLRSDGRITDAIAAAGGLVEVNGAYPEARVSDANGNVETISLQKLLRGGDVTLDQSLSEGSVVYVPGPTRFMIEVAGAVDHPGEIQLNEGDRLSAAIARAGNSAQAQSDLNNIRVMRLGPDGKQTTLSVDLYRALKNGDMSADIALQKGDMVFVPQSKRKNDYLGSPLLYILTRLIP